MVVVVLLVARVPPLERAIGQDRLVAWHRRLGPVAPVPPARPRRAHHRRVRPAGRTTASCTSSGSCCGPTRASWPRPPASPCCSPPASRSYRLARRRMAYETWWSVHLYTYLALFLSFSHQVDTGASFVGHPVARAWWTALWLGTLGVVVAARVGLPVWRSLRHQVRVVGATAGRPGRRLDRPARPHASTGCRSPAASSCSGASCGAGSGGRRTRTRSRRRRRATCCASPSRTSATTAPASPDCAPGTRVAIEGPVRDLHRRHGRARPAAARRRRGRHRADPRAAAGAAAGRRRHRPAARLDAPGPRPARRGRRRGPAARRAPRRRSSGRATRCASTPTRCAGSSPTCAAARSTSAAPTPCRAGSPPSSSAPACPRRRIHFESFTF